MLNSLLHATNGSEKLTGAIPVFSALSLGLLCTVALLAEALFGNFVVPVLSFALISAICLRALRGSYPHNVIGACNVVTTVRAALAAILTGAIIAPSSSWIVFSIAVAAFVLDGVDGWLARRAKLTSEFGARFDMEIDSLLGAVLAIVILAEGTVGAPAILILGFTRYIFIFAGLKWIALRGPLPASFLRKAVCGLQISSLIVIVFPLTPEFLVQPVSILAATALLYSFAVDTAFLVRHGERT